MDSVGKTQIDTVIFDYGNVLSLPQELSDVKDIAAVSALSVEQVREFYWRFRRAYDCNELNGRSYWTSVMGEGNLSASDAQISELIALDIRGWLRVNPDTMKWVEQMHKAGIRLAVLSNMPTDLARYIESNCPWTTYFDRLIFSCDLGRAKPDRAIYETCLKSLNTSAEKVLFLDDKVENIIGAAALGIHGALFNDVESVSKVVRNLYYLSRSRVSKRVLNKKRRL